MNIIGLIISFVALTLCLSVRWSTEFSAFELDHRSKKNKKFETIAKFHEIYSGFLIFSRILALVVATAFIFLIFKTFGFIGGWILSLVLLILSWIASCILEDFAKDIIDKNLSFLLKYFSWTYALSRISRIEGEVKISSKTELLHLLNKADFLDIDEKNIISGATNFREKTVSDVMVPTKNIKFVHAKDLLTPLVIDELFTSGFKIFPVVNTPKNSKKDVFDRIVGEINLDDFREIKSSDFGEKLEVVDAMRPTTEPVRFDDDLTKTLEFFAKNYTTTALVKKGDKIIGMISLSDIISALFAK